MHEILTVAEMAMADKRAIEAGVPSPTLMENAGRAVADVAAAMVPPGAVIVVLTGPGNNGGDGYVAARHLKQTGFDVRIAALVPVATLKGDAAEMAKRWDGPTVAFEPQSLSAASLVIDAIFGAGLNRDVPPDVGHMIAAVNKTKTPVLAVDMPSGVDGDMGAIRGFAFTAARTVTFARHKFGHVLFPGRALCGDITVADIGIADSIMTSLNVKARLNAPSPILRTLADPDWQTHKYKRGHALIVSGGPLQTGAARLAARAALRSGAGLVSVAGSSAALAVHAAHVTAIMLLPCHRASDLKQTLTDARKNAVVVGPAAGVSEETRALVEAALASEATVVLDADALMSFVPAGDDNAEPTIAFGFTGGSRQAEPSPDALFAAIAKKPNLATVLTPHDGEFKRLFGEISGSKVDRARIAAARSGAVVVLKGPDTIIASPDGEVAINTNAPPTLATAGSGDVLAGMIAGVAAQVLPAFDAACAGVWLHGACGAAFGPGLIAEDLPEMLPRVMRNLQNHGA